jgi:hypothetical protein
MITRRKLLLSFMSSFFVKLAVLFRKWCPFCEPIPPPPQDDPPVRKAGWSIPMSIPWKIGKNKDTIDPVKPRRREPGKPRTKT